MFHLLDGVDWDLLHQQKLVLLKQLNDGRLKPSDEEALWGIVHLLDALQDDAAAIGRWTFPGEPDNSPAAEPPASRRYYVEDDDGHHHGPMDDYEEAASVADAIHGRILVQDVPRPLASSDEDCVEGGT